MVRTDNASSNIVSLGSWAPTKPGMPSNIRVNGQTSIYLNERGDSIKVSWGASSKGTYNISGYKVYASNGNGWKEVGSTTGTSLTTSISAVQSTLYGSGNVMPRGHAIGFFVRAYDE